MYNGNHLYVCTVCNRSFARRANLHNHSCNLCRTCGKQFPSAIRLEGHHCVQLKCGFCLKVYTSKKYLNNHKCCYCSNCNKIFSSYQRKVIHKCKKQNCKTVSQVEIPADKTVTEKSESKISAEKTTKNKCIKRKGKKIYCRNVIDKCKKQNDKTVNQLEIPAEKTVTEKSESKISAEKTKKNKCIKRKGKEIYRRNVIDKCKKQNDKTVNQLEMPAEKTVIEKSEINISTEKTQQEILKHKGTEIYCTNVLHKCKKQTDKMVNQPAAITVTENNEINITTEKTQQEILKHRGPGKEIYRANVLGKCKNQNDKTLNQLEIPAANTVTETSEIKIKAENTHQKILKHKAKEICCTNVLDKCKKQTDKTINQLEIPSANTVTETSEIKIKAENTQQKILKHKAKEICCTNVLDKCKKQTDKTINQLEIPSANTVTETSEIKIKAENTQQKILKHKAKEICCTNVLDKYKKQTDKTINQVEIPSANTVTETSEIKIKAENTQQTILKHKAKEICCTNVLDKSKKQTDKTINQLEIPAANKVTEKSENKISAEGMQQEILKHKAKDIYCAHVLVKRKKQNNKTVNQLPSANTVTENSEINISAEKTRQEILKHKGTEINCTNEVDKKQTEHMVHMEKTHKPNIEGGLTEIKPSYSEKEQNVKPSQAVQEQQPSGLFSMDTVELTRQQPDSGIHIFNPIDLNWQLQKIITINEKYNTQINIVSAHSYQAPTKIGRPAQCKHVRGDGNCFFRCMSYVLTGSEEYHTYLRQVSLLHMCEHSARFSTLLRENMTMSQYLAQSRMTEDKVWATDNEIIAFSHLFQTDIYVYAQHGDKMTWVKYSARFVDSSVSVNDKRIYLDLSSGDHYNVALTVTVEKVSSVQKTNSSDSGKTAATMLPQRTLLWTEVLNQAQLATKRNKQYDSKPLDKQQLNKLKANLRQVRSRMSQTKEQEMKAKKIDKNRKLKTRKLRTPEQERTEKDKNKQRMTKHRRRRVLEKEINDKEIDKKRKLATRKLRTPEQERTEKDKSKERMTENRRRRVLEKEIKHKEIDKKRKHKCRKLRTPDQDCKQKEIDKKRKHKCRKLRTPDQDCKQKEIDKKRKHKCRKLRTPDQDCKQKEIDKKRKVNARHPHDIKTANNLFQQHINNSPEYVCIVCHRTLYRNSVVRYTKVSDFAQTFITYETSPDNNTYICNTCKRYLNRHQIPPQAQANSMSIPDTPPVLINLTDFEGRLLAKRYPFMKIVSLPKGQQRGIHGRVINVPIDAEQLCTSLPRTLSTAGIIAVKLKRKQMYNGHVSYENIRPQKIKDALQWLKEHNRHYQNVVDCDEWEQTCEEENKELWKHFTEDEPIVEAEHEHSHKSPEDISNVSDNLSDSSDEENAGGLIHESNIIDESHPEHSEFDTCIQKTDPAIDAANVLSLAPGEGKRPLHIMMDPGCEEQSFPQLFPTGHFGFDADRTVPLTPKKYFNARILNKQGMFAKNVEYLFYAQYITEHKQVMDSVNIAVRKSYQSQPSRETLHAGYLKDPERLKSLIFKDKAYRFLQTVRGSPPYWQQAMYKLLAAVKQFGIFTFFVTVSSADLKWTDTLHAILRQQGKDLSTKEIEQLSWSDKCQLLRSNPVTAARHFDHRLQCIFTDFILGPAEPLGKVIHYSYRIEFQQRGSPHAHCVLWIKDAPSINDSDQIITDFINKYITCHVPSETDDPELYALVSSLQKHNHTATCRKKGTECRFHYPKLPSTDTMIAKPIESEDVVFKTATQEAATAILTEVNTTLDNDKDNTVTNLEDLLKAANVTMEQYKYALGITRRGKTIILERDLSERFINGYNSDLLRAWQANLDVQYCLDPYACIAYMVAYITKDEREMSTVLQNVAKEMQHQDWKEQMKACASAFLNAREVSAQEAVYRLLSFPLFKSNFTTVFVPADLPEKRVKLLKPSYVLQSMEDEEEDIFAINILDRYAARPEHLYGMCLAEFAISYTSAPSNTNTASDDDEVNDDEGQYEQASGIIHLQQGLGIMKRKKKKSVLRYQRKSKEKQPDEYYYSQLLLFLPWTDEQYNLLSLPSYEEHYNTHIDTIELNRSQLEHHADVIHMAVDQFESLGPPLHAFDEIAPLAEQQNECDLTEHSEEDPALAILHPDEDAQQKNLPFELPVANTVSSSIEIRPGFLNQNDYCENVQSLNKEQRDIFQHIFNWCKQKCSSNKTGINPSQLCLFISGGAGTGKSHLIAAIYQMALRTLQREGENPDDIKVILAAPTGTAAHNISGTTLHSAFLLPLGQTQSYVKLSDDKRNTLRATAANLEVLIIDEISMVGSNLLLTLHYRLCEIKSSQQPFGGVSVLAFGDLYQLPPVKQQFIFKPVSDIVARLYGPLWDNFYYTELTQIMRQKDDLIFAQMLNRVRTQAHSENDVIQLQARQVSGKYPEDALHVFSTNKNVDRHNEIKLNQVGKPIEVLVAIDKKPKCLEKYKQNDSKFTGGLPNEIQLCKGARIMLIRNLDIRDGLVNGAQGTVVGFVKSNTATPSSIVAVLVKFDLANTGMNTRQQSRFPSELKACPGATPILRSEVSFTVNDKNKNLTISRYQFPMKLSWACTIHKVQGLTVGEIIVSFDNHFASGQAYVALSRATSMQGLHILNFEPKKIKASIPVKNEMERLQKTKCMPPYYQFLETSEDNLNVSVLNIRSFSHNREDLLADPIFDRSDIIILTETWLSKNSQQVDIFPITHSVFRTDKPIHGTSTRHSGGVAVLLKSHFRAEKIAEYTDQYLQIVCIRLNCDTGKTIHIIGVYNSPDPRNNVEHCGSEIINILQSIDQGTSSSIIIAGDFNQNIINNQYSDVQNILLSRNFLQNVSEPTHDAGSCIDHLYTQNLEVLRSLVANCYYSDHKWLWLTV